MVQRIKTLQRLAVISDDDYRALLEGYGVSSCKGLNVFDARKLIDFLQGLVDKIPEKQQFKRPYEDLSKRPSYMATQKQLRMLEAMWMEVTWQKNRKRALDAYAVWLNSRYGIGSPEWIERDQVGKIKLSLERMLEQREK